MFVLTHGCSDNWIKMVFADEATALAFVKMCWKYGSGIAYSTSTSNEEVTSVNDCGWTTELHEEVKTWLDIDCNEVTEFKIVTMDLLATITNEDDFLEMENNYSYEAVEDEEDD